MTTEDALLRLLAADVIKTDAAIMVVLSCSETKGLSASSLADELGISKQLSSMTCKRLLGGGLIEHRYPYFDRRKVTVYLTPEGIRKALSIKQMFLECGNSLLNDRDVVRAGRRRRKAEAKIRRGGEEQPEDDCGSGAVESRERVPGGVSSISELKHDVDSR